MKKVFVILMVFIGLLLLYTSSLISVDNTSKKYLSLLKAELENSNYKASYFVISGRRWKVDNYILKQISGAASKSQHLKGTAIDIIILDVNGDGKQDSKDVDIVYKILDKKIIKDRGGLGSYKNEKGFFNKQMIHFDSRGSRVRWNR